ncbi:LD-carboxypeptidase [Brevibacillus sp. SYP-B805]|uniref:S66 peptidase family protein n=1 Tax=Brevibacillus sp. SYP-B805 TaxID=1578199 RepID=UPI0013EDD30E|nr:LD-carboxypeptidase [Brevibacillus sp. SYP-B805]NGQ94392.1 LD-carboxypeptidase [Brevibacillus sp. SYP-B805]
MREVIKAAKLQPGDTVGVIAPASCGDFDKILVAARFFEGLGLRVRLGDAVRQQRGYLAGTDRERARDLHCMFADKEVKAVFCARGGYGTGRIADLLDYELIRANPKIFWGYSDITFLHAAIFQRTGLVTFHGPMLTSDIAADDVHPLTLATFQQLFDPQPLRYDDTIAPLRVLAEGEATGRVVGGNLSLLVSTVGTPFEIDTTGKLLFIEEVDEEPYRVDRMLNQLRMAGKLDAAAGIVLGDFHNCDPVKRKEASLTLEEVFDDYLTPAGKPVLAGFRIGHCSPNLAIPLGAMGRIDTKEKTFTIVEPGVTDGPAAGE